MNNWDNYDLWNDSPGYQVKFKKSKKAFVAEKPQQSCKKSKSKNKSKS